MKTIFALVFLLVAGWLMAQAPRLVVPIGHTAGINSVAFSPDGKYILTGSYDGTAKLWDLNGGEIRSFSGHAAAVTSVAFSPDSKHVLTGSWDYTAKLWDLSGREIQSFCGHSDFVTSVAFSPDGKHILTGSKDSTAKLWELSGREIQTFSGHTFLVYSVAFSPDGQQVLTGSWDATAKLWDLSGREVQSFSGHADWVNSVAFSPNGQFILTGSSDHTAKLWDLSGREIHSFSSHAAIGFLSGVTSVAFSPDGKQVLTGSGDHTANLWDLNGLEIQTFSGHASGVTSVAFSPDGQQVLTGSGDHTAKLWDRSGREMQPFSGHASWVLSVAFSPDGKQVVAGGKTAKLWDLSDRETRSFSSPASGVSSMAFSPDGQQVLTGSWDYTAKLWDLSGRETQSFSGPASDVSSVAFSPDGQQVLTGSKGGAVKIWDLSGREIQSFSSHSDWVFSVAFSPDGQQVLTGGLDFIAKLWDLSGREFQSFSGHASAVLSVAFSPEGKQILTGSDDKRAKLWDLSGHEIQTFSGHTDAVRSVAFSPDGTQILTGSDDKTTKLWDLNGREIQSFSGHASAVNSVAFSPDGKRVLTGSNDNTAKLWDTKSGKELATLIAIDSNDWVVTAPSGLFDASSGAMNLMYYVQGLDVIDLEQLKERYYEPGLLAKIMGFDKSELRNVAAFDQVALYPEIKAGIEKDQLAILLTERNGGIGKLSLFINGKEIQEDINPKRLKDLNIDLNTFAKYYQTDTLNTIALRSYNAEGWLKSQAYELTYQPVNKQIGKTIPHLYALIVGTSNYAGEQLDLRFADQDADAMAKAFQSTGSALFGSDRTHVRLLSTAGSSDASSKTNIRQAFADIAAKATPADVLVVYFSGHGLAYGPAEKEQFYYLTKDIGSEDLSDPVIRENYTISSNEFTQWLTAIPAQKQVMIFDACNAGKVVESLATIAQKTLDPSQIRALDRMKDRTGMFILTGSAADKVSYEASQYGQGLLTYSLLQGMSGLALTEDKRVDVMTLFQYSRDKVPELAKGIGGVQTPVLAFPAGGASFDIGIVNAGVKIPVAQVKPVFIRNNFTNEESFTDDLKLTKALEDYFREITAKGARAELIYVDVSEYAQAYSIKGRYTLSGNAVQVRGRLFRGETMVRAFQVTGRKDALGELVEKIVAEALTNP